jgi:hypothetical protein
MKTLLILATLLVNTAIFASENFTSCQPLQLKNLHETVVLHISKDSRINSRTSFAAKAVDKNEDAVEFENLKVSSLVTTRLETRASETPVEIEDGVRVESIYAVKFDISSNDKIGMNVEGLEVNKVTVYTICKESTIELN